ncbi:LysR family transcriptional regulator [Acuticoccus sp. M5D2P5]|uniref:LysR family transcriptional regulator n=1 Tax=Acuticoccus kalidii TaxID=2910977 RepID=UPI001F188E14|nr:LysR family transcriptional regulator [Acuticoccus kalidii]MCF3932635.1 LysR family transcriptional regulator [Acuticoccus kalidii]
MDIRQLRYFVAVVELGSFSGAARHLSVAQPALSRHVRALEETLGVTLVRRDTQGARPTEAGERLLHQASAILRQFDMVPEVVGRGGGVVTGRVVVGLPTSVNAVLARPLIRAWRERLPAVELHVIESLSGFLQEWVAAGRLDICLLYDPRPERTIDIESMICEELFLVGAPVDDGHGLDEVPLKTLEHVPLAMPGATHALRRHVDRVSLENGVRPNVVVEIDSLGTMKMITELDGYFTVLPRGPVYEEIQAGRMAARRLTAPLVTRTVSLATSAVRGRTRACEEVKRLLVETAERLVDEGVWRGASVSRQTT